MPLNECLRMEYRLVHHLTANQGSDFHAGVEAVLIIRSRTAQWRPPRLQEVTRENVLPLFDPLAPNVELQLVDGAKPRL